MKIYRLAGFEASWYTTQTAFYATTLEKAEELCNKLFDELTVAYTIIEEYTNERDARSAKLSEQHSIEREEYSDDNYRILLESSGIENRGDKLNLFRIERRELLDKQQEENMELLLKNEEENAEAIATMQKYDRIIDALYYIAWDEAPTKEKMVKQWMENLEVITLDIREFHSQVDGD